MTPPLTAERLKELIEAFSRMSLPPNIEIYEALRELASTREKLERVQFKADMNTCDVCGDQPLASGRPCICRGTGRMDMVAVGVRELLVAAESDLAATRRERDEARKMTRILLKGKERITLHEMFEVQREVSSWPSRPDTET